MSRRLAACPWLSGVLGCLGLVGLQPLATGQDSCCQPSWVPTFGERPGVDGVVEALAVFDDGGGPALYVGGDFGSAGGIAARGIAKRHGQVWSALGSGTGSGFDPGKVYALAVHDDGSGPALYAAGDFTGAGGAAASNVARWDGASWSTLGSGLGAQFSTVRALAVLDDGGGPALFAGGDFTTAGGMAAKRVARWDGASWSALGSGTNGTVYALAAYDDGGGPALYAGGDFTTAGGAAASRIARWNGSSWSALGSGVNAEVRALAVFDAGGGARLFAGGTFTVAGGGNASRIARWDGSSWSALPGGGVTGFIFPQPVVRALAVHDDGSGPALHVGGTFLRAGNVFADQIAKWDGSAWSALDGGLEAEVRALATFDEGGGAVLYAGGTFEDLVADGGTANQIARWDGSSWSSLGSGLSVAVSALAVFDEGNGPALYAGAQTPAFGESRERVARWDGSDWSALGAGLDGSVQALVAFDDGTGPGLAAAGFFAGPQGSPRGPRVARWDGSSWSELGGPMDNAVVALAVFDDGGGPALHAGGRFATAGGVTVNGIARWNGSTWEPLRMGFVAPVRALAVFDDGSGPALYAGGDFRFTVEGRTVNHVARWDGSRWSPLAGGVNARVLALAVFDDGGGPALVAGGEFTSAGGVPASRIARWDGVSWSALGSGVSSTVTALTALADESGDLLVAGGLFTSAGGAAASRIASWGGSSWAALGSGTNGVIQALVTLDDGSGPVLFAGGVFTSAIDSRDAHLARWRGSDVLPPAIACPSGEFVLEDNAGRPGEVVHFTVSASDGCDPSPSVVCTPPSGSVFPRGTTMVDCTATDACGNQSSCSFPVVVALPPRRR